MLTSANLTLRDYLETFRRQRLVMVAVAIVTVIVGTVPSLLEEPVYASSATVQVRSDIAQSPFAEDQRENESTRNRELFTEVELIQSAEMRQLVVESLGAEFEPFYGVTATVVGLSEIIRIAVTAPSPAAAADVATAYAEVFVEERRAESVAALQTQADELRNRAFDATQQIATVDAQLADPELDGLVAENLRLERLGLTNQVLQFDERADELEVEASLREGGTRVVSRAPLRLEPISPRPLRSAMIAVVLGLLLAVAAAVLLDLFQDRLASSDDLERIDPSLPVLASVPHLEVPAGESMLSSGVGMEAFRYLRASVRLLAADAGFTSITITSATAGEGKTTAATNLARLVAESGTRVVLIDADLRKPAVHKALGITNGVGLADVLGGNATFRDAVHYVDENLAVLPAGEPSAIAPELLGRAAFRELVTAVSAQAELVIVDVPPLLPVADPLIVSKATDATLVLARVGAVRRRELRQALRRFREAGVSVAGFIANDTSSESGYEQYGYDEYVASE